MDNTVKARVLYYTSQKKIKAAAEIITNKLNLHNSRLDCIPSAYSCDKERIVFLCLSVKKDIPDDLRRFISDLDKTKTSIVALLIEGTPEAAEQIKTMIPHANVKTDAVIADEVLFIKGSALAFAGKLSDDEKNSLNQWVDRIMATV